LSLDWLFAGSDVLAAVAGSEPDLLLSRRHSC